jgi:hypothetical protein
MDEQGYGRVAATRAHDHLTRADPRIKEAVDAWWRREEADPPVVLGHTIESLRADFGFKPLGALVMLDILIRAPDEGQALLDRRLHRLT